MEMVGLGLAGIAAIIMFIGGLLVLIEAFKTSIVWGLCYLLVPFAALVFLFMHWDRAKKGFLIWLAGLPLLLIAMMLLPGVETT